MLRLQFVGNLMKEEVEVEKIVFENFQSFKRHLETISKKKGFEIISKDQAKFFYTDEDNDQITISSDEDIKAFNEIKDSVKLFLEGFKQVEVNNQIPEQNNPEIQQVIPESRHPVQTSELSDAFFQQNSNSQKTQITSPEQTVPKQPQNQGRLDSPKPENFYQAHSQPKKESLTLTKEELNELIKSQVEIQLNSKIPEIVNQAAQQSQFMSSQIFLGQSQAQVGGPLAQSRISSTRQTPYVMQKIRQIFTGSQNELVKLLSSPLDEETLKKFDQIQSQLTEEMSRLRVHFQGMEDSFIQESISQPPSKQPVQKPTNSNDFPPLNNLQKVEPNKSLPAQNEDNVDSYINIIQEVYGGDHQQIKKFVLQNKKITNVDELLIKYDSQFLNKK